MFSPWSRLNKPTTGVKVTTDISVSVNHAGVFNSPTWAAQSRGVTAGGEWCVAGWGDTFKEGREDSEQQG